MCPTEERKMAHTNRVITNKKVITANDVPKHLTIVIEEDDIEEEQDQNKTTTSDLVRYTCFINIKIFKLNLYN